MRTEWLKADDYGLERAAQLLKSGEVVAIPTETVYGLAVRTTLAARLNELKGSPADKPLTWLTHDIWKDCPALSFPDINPYITEKWINNMLECAERHVTIILPNETGGTQGYRIAAGFAFDLPHYMDLPIACSSANMSGGEPALTAEQVMQIFSGKIAAVVDGGECEAGIPSAVVNFTVAPPKVIRYGSGIESFQFG
jgi:L-threonylcarbamoyladenylate synthase